MVGRFPNAEAAAKGLDQLILAGFPVAHIFLLGKDLLGWQANGKAIRENQLIDEAPAEAIAGTNLGLTKGLVAGNLLGGATGILLGLGVLALPGIGQIALTSAAIFVLLNGGIFTVAGGLIGSLIGLGLTEQQINDYREQIAQGNYLLLVTGTEREIQCAERIIRGQRIGC